MTQQDPVLERALFQGYNQIEQRVYDLGVKFSTGPAGMRADLIFARLVDLDDKFVAKWVQIPEVRPVIVAPSRVIPGVETNIFPDVEYHLQNHYARANMPGASTSVLMVRYQQRVRIL